MALVSSSSVLDCERTTGTASISSLTLRMAICVSLALTCGLGLAVSSLSLAAASYQHVNTLPQGRTMLCAQSAVLTTTPQAYWNACRRSASACLWSGLGCGCAWQAAAAGAEEQDTATAVLSHRVCKLPPAAHSKLSLCVACATESAGTDYSARCLDAAQGVLDLVLSNAVPESEHGCGRRLCWRGSSPAEPALACPAQPLLEHQALCQSSPGQP